MAGIRRVTEELRPSLLDDLGLLPALRALATDFSDRTGLPTRFEGPAVLPPVPPGADLAIFRAVQEGLSNAARHAAADSVEVLITTESGALVVTVTDDGCGPGAEPPAERMGLAGMRERLGVVAGSVRLSRRPEGGAVLRIALPLAESEENP
jgi:two-component system sensor histidine kinase UhpB